MNPTVVEVGELIQATDTTADCRWIGASCGHMVRPICVDGVVLTIGQHGLNLRQDVEAIMREAGRLGPLPLRIANSPKHLGLSK